jgi:PAS domain S-box-containing protein
MADSVERTVELRLRAAVEASPSGLLLVDAEGRIVLVNQEIERLFGYSREELLGKPVETLIPRDSREGHEGYRSGFMARPQVRQMGAGRDLHGLRKDGTEFPVEVGLTPVVTDEGLCVVSSVVDISARQQAEEEQHRLEEQLQQAQKLEAIGTLAGGIAHDFNNILAAIVGYGEIARAEVDDPEPTQALEEILVAARRGQQVVRRILEFSRRQKPERQPLALEHAVDEGARLLRPVLPATVQMQIQRDPATPPVLADETSIQQILLNLGTNAVHAMPEGGELEISLSPQYVRDSMARSHPDFREGPYAILAVRDSGHGIETEILDRVLEPLFTTKRKGEGSGLGLAVVQRIVREHDGVLQIESQPGQGTTVRCFFPGILEVPEPEEIEPAPETRPSGGTVLYVDDEPALARLGEKQLEVLGFQVTGLSDSTEALETFRRDPEAYDAVVTDYSMPRLDGVRLAEAVTRLRPGLPILLLTGYLENLPEERIRNAGIRRIESKPLTFARLAQVLAEILPEDGPDN